VNRIRVALMDLQPRLWDIVIDALHEAPDLELVSNVAVPESQLEQIGADVVIAGTNEPDDRRVPLRLLAIAPRIHVLMVATNGRTAAMYELRPHQTLHRSISRSDLIAAIRQSVEGREEE
jgi:DNA-binding NarL/FixJ family response regulator